MALYKRFTIVPKISRGVVGVILRLAVLVELRLVTDTETHRHTAIAYTTQSIARAVKSMVAGIHHLCGVGCLSNVIPHRMHSSMRSIYA